MGYRASMVTVIAVVVLSCHAFVSSAEDITSCTRINPCACKTNTGKYIDLSKLKRLTTQDVYPTFDYIWQPCKYFDIGKLTHVFAAQHALTIPPMYYDIGSDPNVEFKVNGGAVQLIMKSTQGDKLRSSYVTLSCSKGETVWTFINEDTSLLHYNFDLQSPACCPSDVAPPSGGSGGGLSVGSILVIVFFLILLLYIILGLLYQIKVKKSEGSDRVPNKTFWASLPGLIRDGFRLVLSCGKKGTYNEV